MTKSVIRITFTAETDIILGNRIPYRNRIYKSSTAITAQKIRGAIFTALYDQIPNDDMNSLFLDVISGIDLVSPGQLQCSECYTFQTMNKAHSTIWECKICQGKNKYFERLGNHKEAPSYYKDYLHEWLIYELQQIENNSSGLSSKDYYRIPFSKCPNGHQGTLKSSSMPICLNCMKLLTSGLGGPKISSRTNIQISKSTRSTKEGALFEYETLEKGFTFQIDIVGEENSLDNISRLKRIFLGRGNSRGFGWIKVCNIEKKTLALHQKELLDTLEQQYEDHKTIVLIARTPIVDFFLDEKSNFPMTRTYLNELPEHWKLLTTLGSIQSISGWSYKSDLQKPRFYAGSPGSIYVYSNLDKGLDFHPLVDFLCGIHTNGAFKSEIHHNLKNFNQFNLWRST